MNSLLARAVLVNTSAVVVNALAYSVALAHPLAALHAHTAAGGIALVLTAMGCAGVAALLIKRKILKNV